MEKKYNIAFIVQTLGWTPFDQGGATIQIDHILKYLRKAGHIIHTVTVGNDKQVIISDQFNQVVNNRSKLSTGFVFRLVESSFRYIQGKLHLPWFQVFDSIRVFDTIKVNFMHVDVLHERNSMHGFGVAMASRRFHLPYVLSVDADFLFEHDFLGVSHTPLEQWIASWTAKYNYHSADAITCVSKVMKDYLISQYKIREEKISIIPNGVNTHVQNNIESIERTRKVLGLEEHPIIMFIGGFYPWHGVELLVEAYRIVIKRFPECRLVLVGDGERRSAVQALVKELEDLIIFVGKIPHELIPTYLGMADILVAPYPRMNVTFWGSPLKLFEYMNAGKAIVASNAGQIGEIVEDHKNGLLVEAGNVLATANAIVELLQDPKLRRNLGENARSLVESNYTWQNYINRLEEVYQFAIEAVSNRN